MDALVRFETPSHAKVSNGSGSGLRPPRPPRGRSPWENDPDDGGRDGIPVFTPEQIRSMAWDAAIEDFRASVLPMIFPQVKEPWRYRGYSTRELRIGQPCDERIDHPRLFTFGRKRDQFVLVTMPYCNVPERGTVHAYDHYGRSERALLTLRFRQFHPKLSWHNDQTNLLLFWPVNGPQPVEWAYPGFSSDWRAAS